jgi:hypothetical protein
MAELPEVIHRYQAAHDARDVDAALSTFGADAVVVDDGNTARGTDEIRAWLGSAAAEYTWVRTLLEASPSDGSVWLVTQNLTGDFPGGTVDLRYRFTLADGLIEELVIAP